MPVTDMSQAVSLDTATGAAGARCAVCPHLRTFHDRIANRYCTATIAGQANRGCVCTPYPEGTAPNEQDKATP